MHVHFKGLRTNNNAPSSSLYRKCQIGRQGSKDQKHVVGGKTFGSTKCQMLVSQWVRVRVWDWVWGVCLDTWKDKSVCLVGGVLQLQCIFAICYCFYYLHVAYLMAKRFSLSLSLSLTANLKRKQNIEICNSKETKVGVSESVQIKIILKLLIDQCSH